MLQGMSDPENLCLRDADQEPVTLSRTAHISSISPRKTLRKPRKLTIASSRIYNGARHWVSGSTTFSKLTCSWRCARLTQSQSWLLRTPSTSRGHSAHSESVEQGSPQHQDCQDCAREHGW